MSATTYPVRVDARVDAPLSRWLWLVKWFLAIPHYFVLAFLWIAFFLLSIVAFFAILFTGRYPRAIFEFNVGVLRWTWRVQYYAYGALATDRYPPFSLQEDPGYPAHLHIDYPERLSRGLVLVKWWLLAIPHYIIVGLFAGGGVVAASRIGDQSYNWAGGGLIGILVLVAAVILLFTGRYPDSIFGFVLGMNRWVLRVAAYAGLMTDAYPPFRLDAGGTDPGGITVSVALADTDVASGVEAPEATERRPGTSGEQPAPQPRQGWTASRVVSVAAGSALILLASGLLAGGAGTLWGMTKHDVGGYVTSSKATYITARYALVSETIRIPGNGIDGVARDLVGKVRIRVTATDPSKPVFLGVARAGAVHRYLSGVDYTTVRDFGSARVIDVSRLGSVVPETPGSMAIWAAKSAGAGTQTVVMRLSAGNWAVVVMSPDATPGLAVRADVGATAPVLPWAVGVMLAAGILAMGGGVLLIAIPVRRAGR
jgi:uncharacterized protein DUF4389